MAAKVKYQFKIYVVGGLEPAEIFLNRISDDGEDIVSVDVEFSRQTNEQVFTIVSRVEKPKVKK